MHMIHLIADYTETREQEILGPTGGWESYLHWLRKSPATSVLISGYYAAFWLVLIVSTMTIAAYQNLHITTWRLWAALLIGTLAAMGTLGLLLGPALICWIRARR
jgi:hypothetical protein